MQHPLVPYKSYQIYDPPPSPHFIRLLTLQKYCFCVNLENKIECGAKKLLHYLFLLPSSHSCHPSLHAMTLWTTKWPLDP